jgi:L-cysteine:1D-myo-inositol 2-amino-2-deoxy-alpha-D-glucopyranoside ligase
VRSWAAPPVPWLAPAVEPQRLRLHDTAGGGLVEAGPAGSPALVYVCGITPYDATHLGHAATYLAFDLLHRSRRDAGQALRLVQNVTDVDDPLLERAARDGRDWRELAEQEIDRFRGAMAALRVLPPTVYAGVVESIGLIVDFVARLRDRGASYELEGDIYFPVAAAPGFGGVAHLDRAEMLALSVERGGDPDRPGKKDPLDALLWRGQRPGEPAWPSPFGAGRPGWHVECTALALAHLGDSIDVQGGGSDLAFPHHELSAAQAIAATGVTPFARCYAHAGMVGWRGEKMSKSRGNLVFVSRLLAGGADPAALRLALLAHHYRDDWAWTDADLPAAEARLARWRAAVRLPAGPPAEPVRAAVRGALAEDLDAPRALRAVDGWAAAALAGTAAAAHSDPTAPGLVADVADALLGVELRPRGS